MRIRPSKIISEAIILLCVFLMMVPIFWIVLMSLKSNIEIFNYPFLLPNPPKFQNYTAAWTRVNFLNLMKNTLTIAVFTIIAGTIISIMSSFVIARFRFSAKIQNAFYVYFISGIITPVFVLLFPVYIIIHKMGLHGTYWSIILPYLGWCAPMNTLILVGAMRNVPTALEEAAALDGCGMLRILFNVFVPVLKPTIATIVLVQFLGIWNEFPLASVMINRPVNYTIALAVSFFKGMYTINYAHQTAAIMIVTIPQLIFFIIFQRYVIEGITAGALKG